jgi:hypothetical protein
MNATWRGLLAFFCLLVFFLLGREFYITVVAPTAVKPPLPPKETLVAVDNDEKKTEKIPISAQGDGGVLLRAAYVTDKLKDVGSDRNTLSVAISTAKRAHVNTSQGELGYTRMFGGFTEFACFSNVDTPGLSTCEFVNDTLPASPDPDLDSSNKNWNTKKGSATNDCTSRNAVGV